MSRHANGEGSIFRRKDGRYAACYYATTTDGSRKRVWIYGRDRVQVHEQLVEAVQRTRHGVVVPTRNTTVGEYLEQWLREVVAIKDARTTHEHYSAIVRNHVDPAIGRLKLKTLSVTAVQTMLNQQLASGVGRRTVTTTRAVLRSALTQAQNEELVYRNVAKLVAVPPDNPRVVEPWAAGEIARFCGSITRHHWYAAYLMSVTYGLRRGEVLGLQWGDIDTAGRLLRIRRQLQRTPAGLQSAGLKTRASRRDLPLLPTITAALDTVPGLRGPGEFVFHSLSGAPVDPKTFSNTFLVLSSRAGLRRIRLHDLRHSNATLMKDVGVPARDAQVLLGHAHVSTTQQHYQHSDEAAKRRALDRVEQALTGFVAVRNAVKRTYFRGQGRTFAALTSGGPGGTRTLDTLLKSSPDSPLMDSLTPVLQCAQAVADASLLGHVAVRNSCQNKLCRRSCVMDATQTIEVLRAAA